MDGQLTYDALCEARKNLVDRFQAYIPLLTNRAQWQPRFHGIRIERADGYRTFSALMNFYSAFVDVYIVENIQRPYPWARHPQEQYIHLTYGITPTGAISCLTTDTQLCHGAERAYQEPVEMWVEAVRQTLLEDLSKRRIQARTHALHEELVAAVWHPRRVAKRLEEGGWEAIEGF